MTESLDLNAVLGQLGTLFRESNKLRNENAALRAAVVELLETDLWDMNAVNASRREARRLLADVEGLNV
jgi:hypothetical protein